LRQENERTPARAPSARAVPRPASSCSSCLALAPIPRTASSCSSCLALTPAPRASELRLEPATSQPRRQLATEATRSRGESAS